MSVHTNDTSYYSPYCETGFPWNALYPAQLLDGEVHYWAWVLDCSEVYTDVEGYEGQEFYSSRIFVDGELLYDTYYSKDQYDYLKNNQDSLQLKYFTLGRCSMALNGVWHYSDLSVYCMRLYNKGLTNEEVLENYTLTKTYYSAVIDN